MLHPIRVIAHRCPACGRLDSLRQTPSPQEAQFKQIDLPKVKGETREKEVGQLFLKAHSPPNKVTPQGYTVTVQSKEAAVTRVMPEHQAWTLVLELPLISITLGKSHPSSGPQVFHLSNESGGLDDQRVLLSMCCSSPKGGSSPCPRAI